MRPSVVMLFAVSVATAASAHAFLDHAVPPVGAIVAGSPPALRLFFSEPIEAGFSGVELSSAVGGPVRTGASAVDPRDQTALVVPLPTLSPGRYRVSWHVVSVDTHRTEGNYEFEVQQ
jgi:methionine-rich copper-binding protein CopC